MKKKLLIVLGIVLTLTLLLTSLTFAYPSHKTIEYYWWSRKVSNWLEMNYSCVSDCWCGPSSGVSIGAFYRDDYDKDYGDLPSPNSEMYDALYDYMDTLSSGYTNWNEYGPGFVEMALHYGYDDFSYVYYGPESDAGPVNADFFWVIEEAIDNGWPIALAAIQPLKGFRDVEAISTDEQHPTHHWPCEAWHWIAIKGYSYFQALWGGNTWGLHILCTDSWSWANNLELDWDQLVDEVGETYLRAVVIKDVDPDGDGPAVEDFEWGNDSAPPPSTALEFNGSSDYVNSPFSDTFGAFTIEFWMKSSDTTNSGTPISMSDGTQHNEILLYNYQNFDLYLEGSHTGGTGVSANDGNWHHLAWTWQRSDGGTKLFKDGIEVYSGTLTTPGIPLTNPSFESGTTGWSQAGYGTISSDDAKHKYGSHSLRVDVSGGSYKAFFQNPSGLEGKTITVGGWVWSDTPNSARVLIMDYISSYETASSDYHPGDSQWHFLTVTKTIREGIVLSSSRLVRGQVSGDGNLAYFDDFIVVEGDNIDAGAPNPTNMIIGQEQDSYGGGFQAGQAFLGKMDEIRIWDDVRTPAEIQDNMHSELTGSESGLVGYWKFDEGEGSIVYDSADDNNGTVHGADWVYQISLEEWQGYGGEVDWEVSTSGDSTVEIDPYQAHTGTRSARIYRNDSNVYAFYSLLQPSYIGFYLKKGDTAYAAIKNGDGYHAISVDITDAEELRYFDTAYHTVRTLSPNTWYHIEFRNIDWDNYAYDIYVDDVWQKHASMRSGSSYRENLYFISWVASGVVWVDDITDSLRSL